MLEILGDHANGMPALDILAALNRRLGTDYPRTSLSPQLSRLKSEGKVTLDGSLWSLVKTEPRKEEAADDDLGEGTSAASAKSGLFG